MIIYVAKGRYLATLGAYLNSHHADPIGKRIHLLSYRALFAAKRLPIATYILTDHDRLTTAERERAWGVCQALEAGSPSVRILNHPARVLLRLEMLRALYRDGINSFQAYPLIGAERPTEFPVFLRSEGEHGGERSELIENAEDLAAEIPKYLRLRRYKRGYGSVIVGFVSSKDAQGRALKYSAFRVGDHIIPRHRFLGRTWFVRGPDYLNEETAGAERDWQAAFAETDQARRIFDIAGIDYGRLDFAIIDGRVQAFEINTNPQTIGSWQDPLRQGADDFFGPRFTRAFTELDCQADGWVTNDMPLARRTFLPMRLTMRLEDARWRSVARRSNARFRRKLRREQRRSAAAENRRADG